MMQTMRMMTVGGRVVERRITVETATARVRMRTVTKALIWKRMICAVIPRRHPQITITAMMVRMMTMRAREE